MARPCLVCSINHNYIAFRKRHGVHRASNSAGFGIDDSFVGVNPAGNRWEKTWTKNRI